MTPPPITGNHSVAATRFSNSDEYSRASHRSAAAGARHTDKRIRSHLYRDRVRFPLAGTLTWVAVGLPHRVQQRLPITCYSTRERQILELFVTSLCARFKVVLYEIPLCHTPPWRHHFARKPRGCCCCYLGGLYVCHCDSRRRRSVACGLVCSLRSPSLWLQTHVISRCDFDVGVHVTSGHDCSCMYDSMAGVSSPL